jgi:hypothetical protein
MSQRTKGFLIAAGVMSLGLALVSTILVPVIGFTVGCTIVAAVLFSISMI